MDINTRIAHLVAAAACGPPVERELHQARVIVVAPHQTQHPGTSAPSIVVLETQRVAYFKRFRDQSPKLCAAYRHDRVEVPMNEVIAWRLAHAMGSPWARLVPPSVLRKLDGAGGALTDEMRGQADTSALLADAAAAAVGAAFWDALIGNQDRNPGNFRYDAATGRLGLIDHGFSFARPGDPINSAIFHAFRIGQGLARITSAEHAALVALLRSGDLHGLRRFLPADRANALDARARAIVTTGQLPAVGAF
jgi:hypothetical protein